jgi:hypothetical protein
LWSDRAGVHTVPIDKGPIDVVCVYCPDTDECYYLQPSAHGASVTLRVVPTRNGQGRGVLLATEFRNLPNLSLRAQFAPTNPERRPSSNGNQTGVELSEGLRRPAEVDGLEPVRQRPDGTLAP